MLAVRVSVGEREGGGAYCAGSSILAGVGGTLIDLHIASDTSEPSITVTLKARRWNSLLVVVDILYVLIHVHLPSSISTTACRCSEHFWQAHVTCSSVAGASKAVLDVLVTCGSCPAIRTIAKEPSIQVLTHAEWKDTIIIGLRGRNMII